MKDLCLPYREGTVYGKHIARRKRSIIGKSLRFFSTLRVGPLDGRKARALARPRIRSEPQAPFSQVYFVGEGLMIG